MGEGPLRVRITHLLYLTEEISIGLAVHVINRPDHFQESGFILRINHVYSCLFQHLPLPALIFSP